MLFSRLSHPFEESLYTVSRICVVSTIYDECELDFLNVVRHEYTKWCTHHGGVGKAQEPRSLGLGRRFMASDDVYRPPSLCRQDWSQFVIVEKRLAHHFSCRSDADRRRDRVGYHNGIHAGELDDNMIAILSRAGSLTHRIAQDMAHSVATSTEIQMTPVERLTAVEAALARFPYPRAR